MDGLFEQAISRFNAQDYQGAFNLSMDGIRQDSGVGKFHFIATNIMRRVAPDVAATLLQRWLEASRFGNMANVSIILHEYFEKRDLYIISASLSLVAIKLGDTDAALELFANCLTDDLPAPLSNSEVIQEYEQTAMDYDIDLCHLESVEQFVAFLGRAFGSAGAMTIIDIPCGTGTAGPALRQRAAWLIGSDISPQMLALAEASGCYDQVICGNLSDVLAGLSVDLVFCHGSLYYFRDLAPVAAAAAAALSSGGYFAFTDYPAPQGVMRTISGNLRYCRAPGLVREIMAAHHFVEVSSALSRTFGLPSVYWLFRKVSVDDQDDFSAHMA